jgi:hypothetical protein
MNALKHAFRSDNADGTDNGQVLCRRDELEGLGRRQRHWQAGWRVRPGKDWARDEYRQSAGASTRGPGGNLGGPKWNDRVGHACHVFGENPSCIRDVGCCGNSFEVDLEDVVAGC